MGRVSLHANGPVMTGNFECCDKCLGRKTFPASAWHQSKAQLDCPDSSGGPKNPMPPIAKLSVRVRTMYRLNGPGTVPS